MRRMRKVASIVGLTLGVLSVLYLAKMGLNLGFHAPLARMLDYYRSTVEFFLGPAELLLKYILSCVSNWVGIDLHLYPHWKYTFLPMWLYFGLDARVYWHRKQRVSAAITILWGGLVALATSFAAGTILLDDSNILFLIFPVTGFVIYEVGQAASDATLINPEEVLGEVPRWWKTFRYYFLRLALTNAIIGCLVILLCLQTQRLSLHVPNLIFQVIYLVALAMRNILLSAWIATFDRAKSQTWTDRFTGLSLQRHGFAIVTVIGGAVLFVVLGACRSPDCW